MTKTRYAWAAIVLLAVTTVPSIAFAQAPATGRLLVATPKLSDLNFAEAVILIVHHGDDGTLGVFINRPTWVDPIEAFPTRDALVEYSGSLYLGGPVAPTQLLILSRPRDDSAPDGTPILDDVRLNTDLDIFNGGYPYPDPPRE